MIRWCLPTNIFSNTFAYSALPKVSAYNPFSTSIFNSFVPTNFASMPLMRLPIFPSFNFGKLTLSSPSYLSKGASILGQNQNASLWKRLGYSAKKGWELAKKVVSGAVGFIGKCARYVKNAISKAGLGKYEYGNACDMVSIMRRNKNFKEINPNGVDLKKLPAGCVLVYGKGVAGYSKKYGHTEITTGNGKAVSDGVTQNLHRKPTAIFMPVAA